MRHSDLAFTSGRAPDVVESGIDAVGIKIAPSGKIVCVNEQTSVPNIYAIGDIVEGCPELTPVAIKVFLVVLHAFYLSIHPFRVPTRVLKASVHFGFDSSFDFRLELPCFNLILRLGRCWRTVFMVPSQKHLPWIT